MVYFWSLTYLWRPPSSSTGKTFFVIGKTLYTTLSVQRDILRKSRRICFYFFHSKKYKDRTFQFTALALLPLCGQFTRVTKLKKTKYMKSEKIQKKKKDLALEISDRVIVFYDNFCTLGKSHSHIYKL